MKPLLNDKGVIARYREFLPFTDSTPVVSLSEGSTPLIHSPKLSEKTGAEVYLKYEGLNPTGSFKDRGMTVAISKAVEDGAHTVICASTGNTSAAAAAYATRADIQEELDRLFSHVEAAQVLLASNDAIGRKFDFLAQEFNREANTLCSKASDRSMTAIGLDLKTVIDQLREQVQNIE